MLFKTVLIYSLYAIQILITLIDYLAKIDSSSLNSNPTSWSYKIFQNVQNFSTANLGYRTEKNIRKNNQWVKNFYSIKKCFFSFFTPASAEYIFKILPQLILTYSRTIWVYYPR